MTIANQTNRTSVVGDGTTQDIPFSFPISATSDIEVRSRVITTGVESDPLTESSDYTVVIDSDIGGTVTMITTFDSTYQIHVKRNTPMTQSLDLEQGGSFNAENIEDALDKNTKLSIENADSLDRTLRFPETDADSIIQELPKASTRAGKFLYFGASDGSPSVAENIDTGETTISAYGKTLIDDASASAALTTLGFSAYGKTLIDDADAATARGTLGIDTDDDVEFAEITSTDIITKSPWFDVRAYGAIANNNSINNVTAINLAVTACLATDTGGVVYFPPGAWWVDDGNITVTNGGNRSIWFVGAGMYSSRIVKTTGGTGDTIIWNCTGNPSGMQNLGIIADVGGNFGVDGISATVMNGVFFENVWMGGFQNGFNLIGTDIHLSNCISEQNNGYGFVFDKEIRAVNCKSYLNGNGFLLKYSAAPAYPDEPCVLIGCNDGESKSAAIDIDSRDNVEIIGFTISSAGRNLNVGIKITGSNQIKILGGNLRYCDDYGIQFVGACSDVIINGITIQEIGQTTTGVGIQMVSGCENVLVSNSILKEIRLSAIKTANATLVRITNNIFDNFGRNETVGDKFGVLLDGDVSYKGATVSHNQFSLDGGDTQTGISWESGAQGKFFIRENEYLNGTLMDLTNAPTGTIVEQNQDNYALNALADDGTPSVKGRKLWKTGGTTTITDFDGGYEGQTIIIIAEHSLIITDGTNIFLSGSTNWSMTATDTLTLICKADLKWYEISRSDSGA